MILLTNQPTCFSFWCLFFYVGLSGAISLFITFVRVLGGWLGMRSYGCHPQPSPRQGACVAMSC